LEFVPCNLCNADNPIPYCNVGRFNVVRCRQCGLFYTTPRLTLAETAEIYSESYFASDDPSTIGYDDYSGHAEGLRQVFEDNLRVIEEYVRPPASILDIGCAFGYFVEIARSRGWNAEGVEISSFASEVARKRTGATIHTGTLANAKIDSASFDAVSMWDALEHTVDPSAELTAVCRILKPGGYLFMTLPNAGSLVARLMGSHWYGFKSAAEHNYFFSAKTVGRALENAGLRRLEIRRGVWPCSARFLTSKLAPYSKTASRLAGWLVRRMGAEEKVVKFKFIDMFVIAQKDSSS
jgi:2-polyprenyl-3-methyl-5-hydroxy-6-metoxy-1,4-benzoquinol methylase